MLQIFTLSLERIVFLDCDELGKHTAQPLGVDEVKIMEETAVFKVKQNATVMEEVSGLLQIHLVKFVSMLRFAYRLAARRCKYQHTTHKIACPYNCRFYQV